MRTLPTKHVFNLRDVREHADTCGVFADYNSNLLILIGKKRNKTNDYVLYHIIDKKVKAITLPSVNESFHHVQLLGENWLLINASVCNDTDPNAFIYKEDGGLLHSFHVGHGVEHIQVTENGEGIYGNFELAA